MSYVNKVNSKFKYIGDVDSEERTWLKNNIRESPRQQLRKNPNDKRITHNLGKKVRAKVILHPA